jgi:Na+/H+ antiporter NhaC
MWWNVHSFFKELSFFVFLGAILILVKQLEKHVAYFLEIIISQAIHNYLWWFV